jgi:hypothetical protein
MVGVGELNRFPVHTYGWRGELNRFSVHTYGWRGELNRFPVHTRMVGVWGAEQVLCSHVWLAWRLNWFW